MVFKVNEGDENRYKGMTKQPTLANSILPFYWFDL